MRLIAASCLLLLACNTGAAAKAVRPEAQKAGEVIEPHQGPCHEVPKQGEPLVVDWRAEQRTNLEMAMKDGVAVVHYDCQELRLLADCSIDGVYTFRAVTPKEQVIALEETDELKANLPALSPALLAKLSGEISRGAKLDIALVIAGKTRAARKEANVKELKGTCQGATHFVRGAYVGAFAMQTATRAEVRTAAQLFGAGGEGSSKSSKSVQDKDGSLESCRGVGIDAEKPPAQCGALLRLELVNIVTKLDDVAGAKGEEPSPLPQCAEGFVLREGKCTPPQAKATYTCKWRDEKECEEQCKKGDLASCTLFGFMQNPLTEEGNQAANQLFERACSGGELTGCYRLAGQLAEGRRGIKADPARSEQLFQRACDAGLGDACRDLSVYYDLGTKGFVKDQSRAVTLLKRGCDAGDAASCVGVGFRYRDGKAVTRDLAKAASYFRKGQDGRLSSAYYELGVLLAKGEGVARDAARARAMFQTACDLKDARGCEEIKK